MDCVGDKGYKGGARGDVRRSIYVAVEIVEWRELTLKVNVPCSVLLFHTFYCHVLCVCSKSFKRSFVLKKHFKISRHVNKQYPYLIIQFAFYF